MDEPTNDLDVETLELLEELLLDYKGTLLLVSHDREFIDNIVTSTLIFEGDGKVSEYVGSYEDWVRQRPATVSTSPVKTQASSKTAEKKQSKKKLSYNDQRELDALPKKIEELENEIKQLEASMADVNFYLNDKEMIAATTKRFEDAEKELEKTFERWEALDSAG
jgi:ATP-binding cassette subfamily F protein uup